jgi:KaiC
LRASQLAPLNPRKIVSDNLVGVKKKKPKYLFEFSKSDRLNSLPEAGEVVNELWGLPIPLRGADTIFKGGLKFSGRQGLVMAIHGGPGAGKTSFALAFAAHVAPFGITTWFLTAEEIQKDLVDRVNSLMPDQVTRLSFFPANIRDYISFKTFKLPGNQPLKTLDSIELGLVALAENLENISTTAADPGSFRIPRPCNAIVILDGLHDLFAAGFTEPDGEFPARNSQILRLYGLIEKLRDLHALVILTTGTSWAGDSTLDYLVDVALKLSYESTDEYGKKPDRRLILTKARHQLCSGGTHGLQIGGVKGVRLSPQISYQLEKFSQWRPRLPEINNLRTGLCRSRSLKSIGDLASYLTDLDSSKLTRNFEFIDSPSSVYISEGSHTFLNGQGSGGKAALAIKLAISPGLRTEGDLKIKNLTSKSQRILVISFLYPSDYYEHLVRKLRARQIDEYKSDRSLVLPIPRLDVIHLYPGHLRPHDLFNKIEWELEAAELNADPYTCVVIDGIHNVFLQFPEIEKYSLFWPQLYNALRSRKITTISTHTTLALPYQTWQQMATKVDDNRSEPLRHALVQKTDFQFEIDPWPSSPFRLEFESMPIEFASLSDLFVVKAVSAIGNRIPRGHVLWNREQLELYNLPKSYFENNSWETETQLQLR